MPSSVASFICSCFLRGQYRKRGIRKFRRRGISFAFRLASLVNGGQCQCRRYLRRWRAEAVLWISGKSAGRWASFAAAGGRWNHRSQDFFLCSRMAGRQVGGCCGLPARDRRLYCFRLPDPDRRRHTGYSCRECHFFAVGQACIRLSSSSPFWVRCPHHRSCHCAAGSRSLLVRRGALWTAQSNHSPVVN